MNHSAGCEKGKLILHMRGSAFLADVSRAVRHARNTGLPLSIRDGLNRTVMVLEPSQLPSAWKRPRSIENIFDAEPADACLERLAEFLAFPAREK